ncbi:MAG: hybrid sensor histidine kinase/response regulator [Nevskia sp.]|nr:hybrid sensor histidine kinase/response regulator [Nevskia sp.]
MLDLFRLEAETQCQVLTAGLLELERQPAAADQLEACMRAAHSIKGAARIVGVDAGVRVAHAMEDCFVAAQRGTVRLHRDRVDLLLRGVDLLGRIANTPETELGTWAANGRQQVDDLLGQLASALAAGDPPAPAAAPAPEAAPAQAAAEARPAAAEAEVSDRVLRVTADNLNRLLGLAGESMVESRWLKPFAESLIGLKRLHYNLGKTLDELRDAVPQGALGERARTALADAQNGVLECHRQLAQRLAQLEAFDGRSTNLANRLYGEALACRMRPFADGIPHFPRMVRDLGNALGKQVRLTVVGETTPVDRDILEKLDAPLGHLFRNAVDHGIESLERRRAAGKPAEGTITLEARHSAGMLLIVISDDGSGIDLERLRAKVVERGLTSPEIAARLSEAELLEFLFLPGFSMKETITDISGRGVGLDVVQDMIRRVRGTVRVSTRAGAGVRFALELPLSLSVVRALLVEVGGEPYAFPLAYILRTLRIRRSQLETLEGRQHFALDGRRVGLVSARQLLQGMGEELNGDELPVVVVAGHGSAYGLVVDRLLGQHELVVHPLDERLGKIEGIAAGALTADGAPVLIVDIEDLINSVDKLVAAGRLGRLRSGAAAGAARAGKRVLVVDDSLTVREVQRKLLARNGYEVEVAVDGIDGWNAVRTGAFDLVVTDIDMPRMDGIELVRLIRADIDLKSLPVMIVSYKDREEDRRRGLEAGADYYLTKGSFHDETLLEAVMDLIGEAQAPA